VTRRHLTTPTIFADLLDVLQEAVRVRVRLSIPDQRGITEAAHLQQVGLPLPEMNVPPIAVHVWDWFWSLSETRAPGFSQPGRITFTEILAWSTLTGAQPTPREVSAICAMDDAFMSEFGKKR
jgi:hypothetical protein